VLRKSKAKWALIHRSTSHYLLIANDLDQRRTGDWWDPPIQILSKWAAFNSPTALLAAIGKPHAISEEMTPQQALRALMEANELNQADSGQIIGSESAVSMFLSDRRGLSKAEIKKLANRFKLDATVFMN